MNEGVEHYKGKRKGVLKSHPTDAITTVRMEALTEAMALLSRQMLTQETVHSVTFLQPACALGPGDTLQS